MSIFLLIGLCLAAISFEPDPEMKSFRERYNWYGSRHISGRCGIGKIDGGNRALVIEHIARKIWCIMVIYLFEERVKYETR